MIVPKGFFPQQDTGRLIGGIQADQSISFQAMRDKLADFIDIVRADPAVESVVGFTGGSQRNTGSMFVTLKPLAERRESADQDRGAAAHAARAGARRRPRSCNPVQDIRVGGRQSNAPLPVHAAGRRPRASCGPGSRSIRERSRACPSSPTSTPTSRTRGSADLARHRPRRRGAPRRHAEADRRHAERRVRPAAGLDHLRAAQPVPRRDGGRARVLAVGRRRSSQLYVSVAGGAQVPLSAFARYARPTRRSRSITRASSSPRRSRSTCRQACRCRRRRARSTTRSRASDVPTTVRGSFQGTARAFQAIARRPSRC